MHMGRSITSGGMGKNDDSANESTNSPGTACRLAASFRAQS
jgi:hypothetical protein